MPVSYFGYILFTMSFWRSSTVNCYQLILPRENAHRIVQHLGRLSNVAFRPSPAQMTFAAQVKVIEQALLKLGLLEEKLKKAEGLSFPDSYGKEEFEAFLEVVDRKYRLQRRASAHTLEILIEEISGMWDRQGQLIDRIEELNAEGGKLHQERTILRAGEVLFGSTLYSRAQAEQSQRQISFKCGVIGKQEEAILRRTLFRMTKGLSIYTSIDYSQVWPQNEAIRLQKQGKAVFFLIFGYGQSRALSSKVQRLLQNYAITSYQYPRSEEQLKQTTASIEQKVTSNTKLVQLVNMQMKESLNSLLEVQYGQSKVKFSKFQYRKLFLLQERKIYERLNQMKLHHNFYQTFVFIQAKNIEKVTTQLHQKLVDDQMPSPQFLPILTVDLPTLFELNSVTATPYEILCAYGTPHYKQANPAILNLTSFPFLFGVMFGDMAHGAILLAFGLLLIFRPMENPLTDFLRPHRHTIALMGFFSFYCGLIYNQYLSLSLNIFGSCYNMSNGAASLRNNCVYSVGLDPIWSIAVNNLNFTNSLKMKIAVIIAIAHMTLGLIVKALNCWQFNKKSRIFIDVLPQIVFLLTIFGYMDFLIIYKWLHEWTTNAPSIITTMINIPLYFGGTNDCCGGEPMWGTYGDTSQDKIQKLLLFTALISIPAMFFLPIMHESLSRKTKMQKESQLDLKDELSEAGGRKREEQSLLQNQKDQKLLSMQEIVVYQLIETIQFVLGCISNTASYLRLWALSLAHSQLSEVFFNETVTYGLDAGFIGIVYNLALFPVFAGITLGILMCMDTMECFLHTLRLHWVEFQSKFYKGDGVQFKSDDFLTYLNAQLKREKK